LAVEIEGRWPWQAPTEKGHPVEQTGKPQERAKEQATPRNQTIEHEPEHLEEFSRGVTDQQYP
jgi:hypothetical protein